MNWLLVVVTLLVALGIGFICYVFHDMDNDDDYNYYD